MGFTEGKILATIWIILNSTIFAPYAIYQTYRFHKNKTKSPFLFNRKPDMVISFAICAIITLSIAMPIGYGWEIFSGKDFATEHYGYIMILYFIGATFILSFWRAWHVWYDAQYQMEAATNTWAKHLDDNEVYLFTKYRNTFGNHRWTSKYLVIITAILSFIFALLIWAKHLVIVEGIVCFTIFLVFVGLLIVIRRLSQVNDAILLRQEYILFASFGLFYGVLYAILWASFHDWTEPDPANVEVLFDALYMILPSPILYILILIPTQWVLYQYEKLKISNKNEQDTSDINSFKLSDIMIDFEGYKVFMEYLVKCVSAENLLYVSEVIQFMRDITKKYGVKASSVQLQTYFDQYKIPKILPKSAIMTKIDATSIRFLRLCEKYVLEQSEFEINISHKNRKNLSKLYKVLEHKVDALNPKITKLSNIFGDDSMFTASRRASDALSKNNKPKQNNTTSASSDIDNLTDNEMDNKNNKNNKNNKKTSKHKSQHSCVEDFQLLSSDEIIQNIYDYLCYTLGDVYTNLNDGCIRFMQTDAYFRWYNNIKKEKILTQQDEDSSSHSLTKEKEKDSDDHNINENEQEIKPMNQ